MSSSPVNPLLDGHFVVGDIVLLPINFGGVDKWIGVVVRDGSIHSHNYDTHPRVRWFDPRVGEFDSDGGGKPANFREMELIGELPDSAVWDA